ncbi:unnamed protein product [Timema podura]|uniref:Uncharacterized protein n=1 Tax=Timema podura TaxID=61482 RepID=A0ABN7PD34_TIMPD|nr:unnamed protein product [Timema podura]
MVDSIDEDDVDSPEVKYRHWLQECYDDSFTKLTHLLNKAEPTCAEASAVHNHETCRPGREASDKTHRPEKISFPSA